MMKMMTSAAVVKRELKKPTLKNVVTMLNVVVFQNEMWGLSLGRFQIFSTVKNDF